MSYETATQPSHHNKLPWSAKRKIALGVAIFLLLYLAASTIMSLAWFTNGGSYDGPRYGLIVLDPSIATIEEDASYPPESGCIGGRYDGDCWGAYDRSKYQVGDRVATFCLLNPFSRFSDDIIWRLDIKL